MLKNRLNSVSFENFLSSLTFKTIKTLRVVFICQVSFLMYLLLSYQVSASEDIALLKWTVLKTPGIKIDDSSLNFEKQVTIISQPLALDLNKNKLLTLDFSEMDGIFLLILRIRVSWEAKNNDIKALSTVRPIKGKRKIRFDFTSNPLWKGIGKQLTITLVGKNGKAGPPEIIIAPPVLANRLSIFIEKWTNPLNLKGIITNHYEWPRFLNIPAAGAIGIFWLMGLIIILIVNLSSKRFNFKKALVIWSLIVWVCIDLSVKPAAVKSLERYKRMDNLFSDSMGPYEAEAKSLKSILENHGAKQFNFFGDDKEMVYLRYMLLPIRLEPKIVRKNIIVLGSAHGVEIKNNELLKDGNIFLRKIKSLGKTQFFAVFSGERT